MAIRRWAELMDAGQRWGLRVHRRDPVRKPRRPQTYHRKLHDGQSPGTDQTSCMKNPVLTRVLKVYQKYRPGLTSKARSRAPHGSDYRDILQDTVLVVMEKATEEDEASLSDDDLKRELYFALTNVLRNYHRKRSPICRDVAELEAVAQRTAPETVDSVLDLEEILDGLPGRSAAVAILMASGFTIAETSRTLDIPYAQVRRHWRRIAGRIRLALSDEEEDST